MGARPAPPRERHIIADSGVRRSLTNSAYNERRADCEAAVELLRPYLPGIRSLRDVTPDEFDRNAHPCPTGSAGTPGMSWKNARGSTWPSIT